MRVYLCRHAEAAAGDPDEARELTATGRAQARALGRRLAALEEPPLRVLCSPLVRAQETAVAIGEAVGAPVEIEPRLAPGATAVDVAAAVSAYPGPVATVGHQPDCSEIALAVSGVDPGFAPGAMHVVSLP